MPLRAIGPAHRCDHADVPTGSRHRHDRTMTRQRMPGRVTRHPGQAEERVRAIAPRLGHAPADLADELAATDVARGARILSGLQSEVGNAALHRLVSGTGHATGLGVGRGTVSARGATERTISRETEDAPGAGPGGEALPLDTGAAPGVTERVGPVTESGYRVEASTLADVAALIGGRAEAGHVGWVPSLDFHQTDGRIDSVVVSVPIDLEMPVWSPPAGMLPRARAEWARWYAALRAHEQGHVDLVHRWFDGLATRILGSSVRAGRRAFADAKAGLATSSRAYDTRTGHGTAQGTVMNVTIEQQERDQERRKQADAQRTSGREGGTPDVGDEGGD